MLSGEELILLWEDLNSVPSTNTGQHNHLWLQVRWDLMLCSGPKGHLYSCEHTYTYTHEFKYFLNKNRMCWKRWYSPALHSLEDGEFMFLNQKQVEDLTGTFKPLCFLCGFLYSTVLGQPASTSCSSYSPHCCQKHPMTRSFVWLLVFRLWWERRSHSSRELLFTLRL